MTSLLRNHDVIWKWNYRQGESVGTFSCSILIRLIFMTIIIVFIFYISVFNWTHLFRIKLYLNISNTKKNKPVYCVIDNFRSQDAWRRIWLGHFYSRRSSRKYQPPLAMVNDNTDPNKSSISSIGLKNIHAKYITKTDKIVYK